MRSIAIFLTIFTVIASIAPQRVKADYQFGTPINMGATINSSDDEWIDCISGDGLELYFISNRTDGTDRCSSDIWVAQRRSVRETWGAPVRLDAPINSDGPDDSPSISADGLELYSTDGVSPLFGECGENPDGYGGSDLWVSTRATKADPWGEPMNLGDVVNTSSDDDLPCISADGL